MDTIISTKSFNFAIDIINTYKTLCYTHKEYVLSKQILKSGTSIGANIREALRGQSKKYFLAKMYIALKESEETKYWLLLLIECNYIDKNEGELLLNKCSELSRILNSIVKTTKLNLNKKQ